jgi:hypothetical protein
MLVRVEKADCEGWVLTLTGADRAGCETPVLILDAVEELSCGVEVYVLLSRQEQAEEIRAIVEPVHWVVYEGRPSVVVTIDWVKVE